MTILKEVRIANRYTQQQFSKLLGINFYTYRAYENGSREIPPRVLAKILKMRGSESDVKLAKILEEVYD